MNKTIGYIKKTNINKEKISKIGNKFTFYNLFFLFLYPLIFIFFIESAARINFFSTILFFINEPFYLFLNYILYFLILTIVLILFSNKWIGFNLINILFYFIAFLNFTKLSILKSGLSIFEIGIFKEKNLFKYLNLNSILLFLLFTIIGFIFLNILLFFIYKFNIKIKLKIIIFSISISFLIIFSEILFPKIIIIKNKKLSIDTVGLLLYLNDKFYLKNLIYNPNQKEVNNIYEGKYKSIKKNILQANIILMQLDYFWYPENLFKNYKINIKENIPNIYKFLNEGQFGNTYINNLEKSDLNGEYEALTGLKTELFPHFEQVRGFLIKDPLMSLASVLGLNGYESYAIINCDKKINNRDQFYRNLGFNKLIDSKDLKDYFKDSYSDELNINYINNILTKNKHIQGKFIFSKITGIKKKYSNLNEEKIFEKYLIDIKYIDSIFGIFLENIQKINKPVIFIFYNTKNPYILFNNINKNIPKGYIFIWDNYSKLYSKNDNKKKNYFGNIDLIFTPELIMNHGSFNKPFYYDYLNKLRNQKLISLYNNDYIIKNEKKIFKGDNSYEEIKKELKILNNDILSGQYIIEKSNKYWIKEVIIK